MVQRRIIRSHAQGVHLRLSHYVAHYIPVICSPIYSMGQAGAFRWSVHIITKAWPPIDCACILGLWLHDQSSNIHFPTHHQRRNYHQSTSALPPTTRITPQDVLRHSCSLRHQAALVDQGPHAPRQLVRQRLRLPPAGSSVRFTLLSSLHLTPRPRTCFQDSFNQSIAHCACLREPFVSSN